jgi:transketolase
VAISVIDMPSIDEQMLLRIAGRGKLAIFAEQNNGFLWQNFGRILLNNGAKTVGRVIAINTLSPQGKPQFIHSGLYEELLEAFELSPRRLAERVVKELTE